ncbi:lytic transglycosylase domain-containing protein [Lysobacter sp. CFH 32150]|uniref:lytic transglycosylase domain-containing protein n=1 Tax=Lysobacter sp. CFH 32150 TaxID=2927128 RepID=UPI001FA761D8|nr:lytic transglycosylase domain-containing protein [Lysobacter sp. CFH 32150]MCI4566981.1 transglycosylase SLT domain-containing protein [Lysobacter sp. CFH 32150]
MKGARGILALLCVLAAAPAAAGTLYRCDSADGSRSYVSKRVAGAKCTVISYKSSRASAPTPAVSKAPVPAVGSVTPANLVSGSPATVSVPAVETVTTPVQSSSAPTTRLVQGQVYSYIKDGVRHYTSKPPRGVAGATALRTIKYSFMETCFACGTRPGVNFNTLRLNTAAYQAEIAAAARQHGVEESIVRAIIHAESAFNPNALSRVGAQGLMQLMPATARRFGVGNAFDANQNIAGGVQYLAWLLKRFDGNLTLAAAGYNAGEGAVDKYKGVPPYSETRRYVERVAVLAERYRGALASNVRAAQ